LALSGESKQGTLFRARASHRDENDQKMNANLSLIIELFRRKKLVLGSALFLENGGYPPLGRDNHIDFTGLTRQTSLLSHIFVSFRVIFILLNYGHSKAALELNRYNGQ
jgi:hypothetical protein